MIISKSVDIKATGNMIKKYNCKNHEIITINITDLSIGSHAIVDVECDYCNSINRVEYRAYIKQIKSIPKYTCQNSICLAEKLKEICLINYGVGNFGQLDRVKEKIKNTNLEKYGVENAGWTIESQIKIKSTNLEKYGVENVFQSDEVKEKIKNTNLERYGVGNPGWIIESQEKIKNTNLKKYGVENYAMLESSKYIMKEYNMKKYGVESVTQLQSVKDKSKNTNLEKYGVEYASQSYKVKEKIRNTNLKKYGVEYFSQSNEFWAKFKKSLKYKIFENHYYQTSYELDFLIYCKENTIELSLDIPRIEYYIENKKHYYFPDFFIKDLNLIMSTF